MTQQPNTPATVEKAAPEPMTAHRAAWFLERFKRAEKLLGPNEQKALLFAIEALEGMAAQQAAQPVAGEPVAYAVMWGVEEQRMNSVHIEKATAQEVAASIKSRTEVRPLCFYTAAPAPVGLVPLTDEQVARLWSEAYDDATGRRQSLVFARSIEAAHGIKAGKDVAK